MGRRFSSQTSSNITTGIPFKRLVKVKKEFIHSLVTNDVSNSYIYTIAGQNPNGGSIRVYNGSSNTALSQDASSCAGIDEWFAFYEDAFVRGCKIRADIANNQAGNAIVVDYGPTVKSTLAYGTGSTYYDASGYQPAELPMFKRTILGGSNSQQTTSVKFYMPIRKLLGVKDMEDIYNNGDSGATSTLDDPQVPGFNSSTDTNGQTLATGSVFGNIVLTSMQSFTTPPGTPVGPPHSVRFVVTYYIQYRNRKILQG